MHKKVRNIRLLSSANHIVSKPIQLADTFSRLHWIKSVELLAEKINARDNPMIFRYKREINLQMEHKKNVLTQKNKT
jgi:hypothetical protein